MSKAKKIFVAINLVGGLAVLSSYLFCFILYPTYSRSLWGSASDKVITFFVISMVLAHWIIKFIFLTVITTLGHFKLDILFPSEYPYKAPKVKCRTNVVFLKSLSI